MFHKDGMTKKTTLGTISEINEIFFSEIMNIMFTSLVEIMGAPIDQNPFSIFVFVFFSKYDIPHCLFDTELKLILSILNYP